MGDEEGPRCIVCDPAHPHNVSRRADYNVKHGCFACGKNGISWEIINESIVPFHYYCTICDIEFHARCLQIPSKMIHPYHPQHPLTFTFLNYETKIIVNTNYGEFYRFLCRSGLNMSEYLETIGSKSNILFDKCTLCRKDLSEWFYRCSICNFSLDFRCARNFAPLTIQNPKSHHHSLALFRRPHSFPCDACGLINLLDPSYACYQCDYMVHKSCIDLPRVIKITRHPHRLSHAPYLPTKLSLCRVCYKNVDIKYGQYSCNYGDCSYVVHSKCATHRKIWDGGELEWAPEEPDETEDIAPFKKVGDGLIQHFCHQHHYLKLEKYNGSPRDSKKQCHACVRPITSHDFYNCVECDLFLHEVCANLPRKLDHALHNHPLYIDPYPLYDHDYGNLCCSVCFRKSSGLMYRCIRDECVGYEQFQLDLGCVLVPEYFTHKSHAEHPLFISPSYNDESEVLCQGCNKRFGYHLHCCLCEFVICYECATIPDEIYYKYDEHPLSLCHGENGVGDMYWCEICEERIDPKEWFYTNKECCTTIHHKCLFGDSAYMKPGHTFDYCDMKVDVVGNGSSSRPTCRKCRHHCPYPVYFKVYMLDGTVIDFCSFSCLSLLSFPM